MDGNVKESLMIKSMEYYLILLLLFPLVALAEDALGFLAFQHSSNPEHERYSIAMYENAYDTEPLGVCESNGYFALTEGSIDGHGRDAIVQCRARLAFVGIETGYESNELLSYGRQNGRYRVMLWPHSGDQGKEFLWIETSSPLEFSDFKTRIIGEADAFTETWDGWLYLSPGGEKSLLFDRTSLDDFLLSFDGSTEVGGRTWLRISSIGDYAAFCSGPDIPGRQRYGIGFWVPLLDEQGGYNIKAFSSTRGC